MGFTTPFFIFICFPLIMGGFGLIYMLEKNTDLTKNIRLKELFLITVSIAFYGWSGLDGIIFILIYIILVYALGWGIERLRIRKNRKKLFLGVAVSVILLILIYYKYTGFLVSVIEKVFSVSLFHQIIWVPIGISFITFSALSYLIDIWRGDAKRGKLIDVALYITFFPKVVSGPIVLWKDFNFQITERKINVDKFLQGLNRIMIGFAKKLILADYFGSIVLEIQGQVPYAGVDILSAWLCAIIYSLQLYYDFSAYSDIAIGISNLFGFEYKENFNFPYTALSITEFWRRWHISLGTWFREYLYIPLGGNRKGKKRTLINLGIVFLMTGIWHGAGWNYILWGMLHGAMMLLERCIQTKKLYQKTPKIIKWLFTMFIVCIGWQAFRINGITDLMNYYGIMFGIVPATSVFFTCEYYLKKKTVILLLTGIMGASVLRCSVIKEKYKEFSKRKYGVVVQEVILFLLMGVSILCMINSTYSPFIYFQY